MRHYYAVAERGREGRWFLTFLGRSGYSFAEEAEQIASKGRTGLHPPFGRRRSASLD